MLHRAAACVTVPSIDTASPSGSIRTCSRWTSSSRKDGQPWSLLSAMNSAQLRPRGAVNNGKPVTVS